MKNYRSVKLNMKIKVRKKFKFGTERSYPACPKAKIFLDISGGKTLLPKILEMIKSLGYEVEVEKNID